MSIDAKKREVQILSNMPLVFYVVRTFYGDRKDYEDLCSIGMIGLIKAVDTYSEDRQVKFSTYAVQCIRNEIKMEDRKKSYSRYEILQEERAVYGSENETGEETDQSSFMSQEDVLRKVMVEQAINELTKEEQEIIFHHYGLFGKQMKNQGEIARAMGVSQSYISRVERRAKKKLLDTLTHKSVTL